MIKSAPENKERQAKEGEPEEPPFGPDGCRHIMQEEMIAAGLSRQAPEDQGIEPPAVRHLMEEEMKKEAIKDEASEAERPDNTLPTPEEPPLPGKPPEPPLGGGEGSSRGRR